MTYYQQLPIPQPAERTDGSDVVAVMEAEQDGAAIVSSRAAAGHLCKCLHVQYWPRAKPVTIVEAWDCSSRRLAWEESRYVGQIPTLRSSIHTCCTY